MMHRLKVGLEWFLNPDHVPFLVAEELGYFAEAGLEVELVEPQEHLDAIEAIQSGELDVAITEPLHLVEDRAEGHPVVGFARFLHTNGGVMYLEGGGIERPRDMVGCRMQYPGAPGPGGPAIVGTMIEADGGTYDPDGFERVNNGFYHTDALLEGKADVATLVFYNFEILEAKSKGLPARFFALKDWGVPDFCQLILITSEEIYREREGQLRGLLKGLNRGLDVLHQDPERARAIYFERVSSEDKGLMSAIFDATVPCFTFDMSMSSEYYEELSAWLVERGLIGGEVRPESCWSNQLVRGTRS